MNYFIPLRILAEMKHDDIKEIYGRFQEAEDDFYARQLKSGHINSTYLIKNNGNRYIIQKINTDVFQNLEAIMGNIQLVASHLEKRDYPHEILKPLPFKDGNYIADGQWRVLPFIENTQEFQKVQSAEQAFKAASFLSEFHSYLADVDKEEIKEPIPGFIDFNNRYRQFTENMKTASPERIKKADKEIKSIQEQRDILSEWDKLLPRIPQRFIHADPKISNFLFAEDSADKIKALIDWDTMMCGPILYDFGDMVRSYTNLKDEDDPSDGPIFSSENYAALRKGFLSHLSDTLSRKEIDGMQLAAQAVIYVQAIRFLTDYLNDDKYYATDYPQHNLDRTRNQLNLLRELKDYLL